MSTCAYEICFSLIFQSFPVDLQALGIILVLFIQKTEVFYFSC